MNLKLDAVIDFHVPHDAVVERLSNRLVCRNCGAVFNKITHPPQKEDVCDLCGGEIYQRTDDRKEAIEKRLSVYETETAPLRDYYRSMNKLTYLDGEKEEEVVFRDIMTILHRILA
jgi:adenylate kinase